MILFIHFNFRFPRLLNSAMSALMAVPFYGRNGNTILGFLLLHMCPILGILLLHMCPQLGLAVLTSHFAVAASISDTKA